MIGPNETMTRILTEKGIGEMLKNWIEEDQSAERKLGGYSHLLLEFLFVVSNTPEVCKNC